MIASNPYRVKAVFNEYEARLRNLHKRAARATEQPPKDWRKWLTTLLPKAFTMPLAQRHVDFWRWGLSIRLGDPIEPFAAIWPRGGGKTTQAEALAMAVGVRGHRHFVWYVRDTQKRADEAVGNIASMLESREVSRYYPEHARRELTKFGHSKGWTQNTLRTEGGFKVQALGLDTAARGVKLEENRPDMIIFDDIDDLHDTNAATHKKIETITRSILPAGSKHCAVLLIQNLINKNGLFTQLVDGRADFLQGLRVSGPFPAVEGLAWEWREDPENHVRQAVITAGKATWAGQDMDSCQRAMALVGPTAFLREFQHAIKDATQGLALRTKGRWSDLDDDECRRLVALGRVFGGIDFGEYRFFAILFAVDERGVCYHIDEHFSQRESLSDRAQEIHNMLEFYGWNATQGDEEARSVIFYGDCANPQDVREMNEAFIKGWEVPRANDTVVVSSKIRCVGVLNENKSRRPAVSKINNALDHGWLRLRKGLIYDWFEGLSAVSEGTPHRESRLAWELSEWSFPAGVPGEAQDQNPDDETADGADGIAAMRYALLSHWGKARTPIELGKVDDNTARKFDYKRRQWVDAPHLADDAMLPADFLAKVQGRGKPLPPQRRLTPMVKRPSLLMPGGRLNRRAS